MNTDFIPLSYNSLDKENFDQDTGSVNTGTSTKAQHSAGNNRMVSNKQ